MKKIILFCYEKDVPFSYSVPNPAIDPDKLNYVSVSVIDETLSDDLIAMAKDEGLTIEINNGLIIYENK